MIRVWIPFDYYYLQNLLHNYSMNSFLFLFFSFLKRKKAYVYLLSMHISLYVIHCNGISVHTFTDVSARAMTIQKRKIYFFTSLTKHTLHSWYSHQYIHIIRTILWLSTYAKWANTHHAKCVRTAISTTYICICVLEMMFVFF